LLAFAGAAQAKAGIWRLVTPQEQVTTLITPTGAPVGGKWQRWADDSKVPTYRGTIVFSARDCPGLGPLSSCTEPTYAGPAGALVGFDVFVPRADPGAGYDWQMARGLFLHELGNAFDEAYLTPRDMDSFGNIWREHPPGGIVGSWWSGAPGGWSKIYDAWSIPGEQFAEGYQFCALYGQHWDTAIADTESYDFGYAAVDSMNFQGTPSRLRAWAIGSQRATCRLIDAISRRVA
jgi:hypothetical protein